MPPWLYSRRWWRVLLSEPNFSRPINGLVMFLSMKSHNRVKIRLEWKNLLYVDTFFVWINSAILACCNLFFAINKNKIIWTAYQLSLKWSMHYLIVNNILKFAMILCHWTKSDGLGWSQSMTIINQADLAIHNCKKVIIIFFTSRSAIVLMCQCKFLPRRGFSMTLSLWHPSKFKERN